ncbi:SAG-related sequence SRS22I [Besnoitia besnoiti]|uniref:SAG-related sequence SRS22I n=1 Tax=Besnoitia besnoiti TaxID=94643 RepID=A0A2A9MC53_BESBE|nr:SAG-related sequence SRS22I [Besnoitia besnoiti]PFH32972.1 SAG-related sequence SRS22I [Besnoitia besnoiti]
MKLSLACLGAAAAIALCFREASAVRQATSHSQMESGSPTEQDGVPTCEKAELPLSISTANGTAAFKCAKDSQLSPVYQQNEADQQVYIGDSEKKLSEVLKGATLKEKSTAEDNVEKERVVSSPHAASQPVYSLSVAELPEQEKKIMFKCTKKTQEAEKRQPTEENNTVCTVTITVASSAAEKAFAVHSSNPGGVVPNWHSVAEVSFLSSSTKAGRTVSIAPQFF